MWYLLLLLLLFLSINLHNCTIVIFFRKWPFLNVLCNIGQFKLQLVSEKEKAKYTPALSSDATQEECRKMLAVFRSCEKYCEKGQEELSALFQFFARSKC